MPTVGQEMHSGETAEGGKLQETLPYEHGRPPGGGPVVRRFRLTVVEGPGVGSTWESASDVCSIGSHPLNDFPLDDSTVSRFHCEVRIGPRGPRVKDLDSTNGVIVDGVQVADAYLRGGSLLRLGREVLRFDFSSETNRLQLSENMRFGSLIGTSVAMRGCFALLERASARDVTVLLEGETGTGKSQAALAIHQAGSRRDKPFIVVDCGAIPSNLLESELFGHEKGAFTGALGRRAGAFEEAHGGTVFLDEIGELPPELQPKLLRVLETREIRRVGSNTYQPVDIRLIAATHRDLRAEVNAGRFRSDLFFRLAVLRIVQPSLRQRPEDLPLLVDGILSSLGADPERTGALRTPEFIAKLRHAAWPGNVRELRNYLERCLVFEDALDLSQEEAGPSGSLELDPSKPYADQRRRVMDDFERRYLRVLLEKHQGKVAQAAVTAGMDRVHLYRLLRRHGIKP
ncbi:sigma 54-interacting transcriptional regulator [Stigmatella sp. ncwal1]|uniref:Sigma 54-interacting transcriptional regulator n=1 Tax=Stigmatella ashevillensis TaxID=2995309 RepID=A0ABT5DFS8_9BACT|nr:sigma 54-interacting transcriptional regulator [Stigmatella ashevillena]MDC0712530.1 sigma 54-interacting transcriptional regulator [Stigmatella ashevillena]